MGGVPMSQELQDRLKKLQEKSSPETAASKHAAIG
jgi:hypothetical protein